MLQSIALLALAASPALAGVMQPRGDNWSQPSGEWTTPCESSTVTPTSTEVPTTTPCTTTTPVPTTPVPTTTTPVPTTKTITIVTTTCPGKLASLTWALNPLANVDQSPLPLAPLAPRPLLSRSLALAPSP